MGALEKAEDPVADFEKDRSLVIMGKLYLLEVVGLDDDCVVRVVSHLLKLRVYHQGVLQREAVLFAFMMFEYEREVPLGGILFFAWANIWYVVHLVEHFKD